MMLFDEMPKEAQFLFNPAFCGEIIHQAVVTYNQTAGRGCSYSLTFLILPVILNKASRDSLPSVFRKQMHVWIQENQHVRIRFAERCRDYIPVTRHALNFLFSRSLLQVDQNGEMLGQRRGNIRILGKRGAKKNAQPSVYSNLGSKLGKWFAEAGDPSNVFTMWGVRP